VPLNLIKSVELDRSRGISHFSERWLRWNEAGDDSLSELRDRRFGTTAVAEDAGSGNDNVSASSCASFNRLNIDATVNLNILMWESTSQLRHLWHLIDHEFLPAKSRLNRHHEQQIDQIAEFFNRRRQSFRFDRNANLHAVGFDARDQSGRIRRRFDVEGEL